MSKKKRKSETLPAPSFFLGPTGIFTLGALIQIEAEGVESIDAYEYLEKVLSLQKIY